MAKKSNAKNISAAIERHENHISELVDAKDFYFKKMELISKLQGGKIGVSEFLKELSPDMAIKQAEIALTSDNEKNRLAAITDWLDRAGFSKVEKHAIASIDPNVPKEQLIAMLSGLSKKTKAIEIDED